MWQFTACVCIKERAGGNRTEHEHTHTHSSCVQQHASPPSCSQSKANTAGGGRCCSRDTQSLSSGLVCASLCRLHLHTLASDPPLPRLACCVALHLHPPPLCSDVRRSTCCLDGRMSNLNFAALQGEQFVQEIQKKLLK